jgi:hypothetical protein
VNEDTRMVLAASVIVASVMLLVVLGVMAWAVLLSPIR